MSPFVSNVTSLFSGDLAAISADLRQLRAEVLIDDIAASHEAHDGVEGSEIVVRFVAALSRRDSETEFVLWQRAHELDAAQPFGPRLVDELDALSGRFGQAA